MDVLSTPSRIFSSNISGVQPQPNGNFLICQGAGGQLFEVTREGDMVWEYINPEGNFGVVSQGNNPSKTTPHVPLRTFLSGV